jgi:flagellar protein FlbD
MGGGVTMVKVTKLNGVTFWVNPYEIEFIEETPDTVISLRSGKKVLVSEEALLVIDSMVRFYQLVNDVTRVFREDDTQPLPEK